MTLGRHHVGDVCGDGRTGQRGERAVYEQGRTQRHGIDEDGNDQKGGGRADFADDDHRLAAEPVGQRAAEQAADDGAETVHGHDRAHNAFVEVQRGDQVDRQERRHEAAHPQDQNRQPQSPVQRG